MIRVSPLLLQGVYEIENQPSMAICFLNSTEGGSDFFGMERRRIPSSYFAFTSSSVTPFPTKKLRLIALFADIIAFFVFSSSFSPLKAETFRRNPVLSAKKFSEITYVIKSALFADAGKAVLIQVFSGSLGQKSPKTAEAFPFVYLTCPGDLLHHDLLGIMLVDVIQYPAHPFRLKLPEKFQQIGILIAGF